MADELIEGVDFTFENGLMVFTAEYLQRRGHCCLNGCKNCPYRENEPALLNGDAGLHARADSQ